MDMEWKHFASGARYGYAYFASGANHPGEIDAFSEAGINVGVSADQVYPEAVTALEELAGEDVHIFLDSGAFGEITFPTDGGAPYVKAGNEITPTEWERRLDLAVHLAERLGDQLHTVAPDKVAFQDETLERLATYAGAVRRIRNSGAVVIVPLQKGRLDLVAAYDAATEILGDTDWTYAFPMKKDATKLSEILDLLERRPSIDRIHLLGIGRDSAAGRAVLAALEDWTDSSARELDVTSDSVRITALVGRYNGPRGGRRVLTVIQDAVREEMLETALHLDGPDGWDYTDHIGQVNPWLSYGRRHDVADFLQETHALAAHDRRAFLRDPDAWLQEDVHYLDPRVEIALDREFIRWTLGIFVTNAAGRERLNGGKITTRTRKAESLRRWLRQDAE